MQPISPWLQACGGACAGAWPRACWLPLQLPELRPQSSLGASASLPVVKRPDPACMRGSDSQIVGFTDYSEISEATAAVLTRGVCPPGCTGAGASGSCMHTGSHSNAGYCCLFGQPCAAQGVGVMVQPVSSPKHLASQACLKHLWKMERSCVGSRRTCREAPHAACKKYTMARWDRNRNATCSTQELWAVTRGTCCVSLKTLPKALTPPQEQSVRLPVRLWQHRQCPGQHAPRCAPPQPSPFPAQPPANPENGQTSSTGRHQRSQATDHMLSG